MDTVSSGPTATSIRSTKGCWTCRLRKKKCDEVRPRCLRCDSVNIECHYGPKPRWIETPALGKEELERIKTLVSTSASRKRAAFRAKAQSGSIVGESPRPPLPVIPSKHTDTSPRDLLILRDNASTASQDGMGSGSVEGSESVLFSKWIGDQEANLIMHYLDHVFYIQFRFHTPSISAGGRGWLLSLLTRTKPLYHAALSLSAFHQQSLVLLEQGGPETDYLQELQRQHNLTLKELQLFIQAHSLTHSTHGAFDRNVQILACVVQLISFELFNGGISNWQVHLRAASDLVLMLYEISPPDTPSSQGDLRHVMGAKSPESFALKFFTGCIIWFDTLSCVSTGSRSYLAEFHDRLLLDDATGLGVNIQLHTIAGCHNWVMRMIGEIASLSARKNERTQFADAEIRQLYDTAHDIQRRLELRHKEILEELEALRHLYGGPPPHSSPETYNKHTVLVVTNIFASAAAIYLHSIARSEVASSLIPQALHKTIDAMRMIPDPRMVRGLVWPLCIAGCMASSTPDQEFFRNAAAGAVHDSRRFGNSGKALEILEMSWRLQKKRGQLTDCASTIRELGTCVLLV